MDTFDRIAQFVREYCGIKKPSPKNTHFRTIWTQSKIDDTLRPEFITRKNVFLLALFDLSIDLRDKGYYREIYEYRNAITHRYLVVHELMTPEDNTEVTSRIRREELVEITITAMQLLRAAIMYLILFVDVEEKRNTNQMKDTVQCQCIELSLIINGDRIMVKIINSFFCNSLSSLRPLTR